MSQKVNTNGASFGKIMLASAVGVILVGIVLNIFSLIFFVGIASKAVNDKQIPENTVLKIKLNYPIVEQHQQDYNFDFDLPTGLSSIKKVGLNRILSAIKYAKTDKSIKGIFLDLTTTNASLSELQEIRNALLDFKKSGKFVIAHADFYTAGTYFLASAADKVYMTPTGTLLWKGFSVGVIYYKKLFDKLGVKAVIIRHGKFKSAVEPYFLDSMSNENREQLQVVLDNYWNKYIKTVADNRNLDVSALNTYADNLSVNSSQKAVDLGLIDALKYRNDVIDEMKNLIGLNNRKSLKTITLAKYISRIGNKSSYPQNKKDKIAIVYAEGEIIEGKSTDGKMGSITIADAIRKASMNKDVKAIVLRVNSPGGSALASEVILHEIIEAKKNKPVIVSMGRYAASGGYYISCYGDKIFAEPYTLTGSIGVFGMFFNLNELVNNKLGLKYETVKTNNYSDFGNLTRKPSEAELTYWTTQIEGIYQTFIKHVAEGRNLKISYVDSIGQGRIWCADDALKIGLIDTIGGINDAIQYAAKTAHLSEFSIKEYPKTQSFIEKFMEDYSMSITRKKLGLFYDTYQEIENLKYLQGIQTILPYKMEIKY